jgi:hypothetical protein
MTGMFKNRHKELIMNNDIESHYKELCGLSIELVAELILLQTMMIDDFEILHKQRYYLQLAAIITAHLKKLTDIMQSSIEEIKS